MIHPTRLMLVVAGWENSPDEAKRRVAVSRAYYAVYHAAIQACEKLGLAEIPEKSHWRLIHFLNSQPDDRLRCLGDLLHELKRQRQVADYRLQASLSRKVAKEHMHRAKQALRLIDEVTAGA